MLVLPADAPRAHRGSKIVIIMGDLSRRGGAARIDGGGVREILYHGCNRLAVGAVRDLAVARGDARHLAPRGGRRARSIERVEFERIRGKRDGTAEIGRASCRERVCQYV